MSTFANDKSVAEAEVRTISTSPAGVWYNCTAPKIGTSAVRERVTQAMDALAEGMRPFIESGLSAIYKERWEKTAAASFREGRGPSSGDGQINWDAHAVLTVLWDQWNSVFRHHLSPLERSLVGELREFRNRWAHQDKFDFEDVYRVMDSVHRLLDAIDSEKADEIAELKRETMRHHFSLELDRSQRMRIVMRRKWIDLIMLLLSAGFSLFTILYVFGTRGWILAVFVVLAFCYVISQRWLAQRTVWYSAHECPECGRVIYDVSCPYCSKSRAPATTAESAETQRAG